MNSVLLFDCQESSLSQTHCWFYFFSSLVEIVEILLERDPQMLYMMDVRGLCPLSDVPERDYEEWIQFLESKRDIYWPAPKNDKDVSLAPACITEELPNSRPVPNPKIVLPSAFIQMLASGRMNADEVMLLCQTYEDDEDLHFYFDDDFSFHSSFGDDPFDDLSSLRDNSSSASTAVIIPL